MVGGVVGDEMIRRKMGLARLVVKGRYSNWEVMNLTLLGYFLILFPMDYVKGTMLP